MKTKLLAASLMAALAAVQANADKVTLKSGSFLTGKAGLIQDGKLAFTSDDVGEIKIDVKKIASLESDKDHVVQYKDRTEETKKVSVKDGDYVVGEEKLDMANVKAIDPNVETWHGSVNFAGTVTRGNTVGESATITADVNRRWEKDRFTADGGYYYSAKGDSKQTKTKDTSRFALKAQEDHFWNGEGFYTYVNGNYEFDKILMLEYQARLGVGVGYQWFEKQDYGLGKMSFNQELGGTYVFEKYEHKDSDEYGTVRYAHHFSWDLMAVENLAFTHNLEFLPQLDEPTDNYLFNTDAGLTYSFSKNWQLTAKAEWDYKKKVTVGAKHSDLRYILGVGYKW